MDSPKRKPISYLYECFTPDFNSGLLVWNDRPRHHFNSMIAMKISNGRNSGKEAGSVITVGQDKKRQTIYKQIKIGGFVYRLHHVIWAMYYGYWPSILDHINGNGLDNSIGNLRVADSGINAKNLPLYRNNKSGHLGVYKVGGVWRAIIGVNGEKILLGNYREKEDAILARKEAEKEYGFHKNHGRKTEAPGG